MADTYESICVLESEGGIIRTEPFAGQDVSKASIAETVKEKARDLASAASEMLGDAKGKVQEWAADAADVAGQVKDKAQELATAAVHKAEEYGEDLTTVVRRYPIQSMLVGFGLGLLVAPDETKLNITHARPGFS